MKRISYDELNNNYDSLSNYCNNIHEPIILSNKNEDDLVIMSMDTYNDLIETLRIKEALVRARIERANGAKIYSVDEAEDSLNKIFN